MVVIGVCGITGAQGGAVASIFNKNGDKVIGITRNPDSKKSKELLTNGIELRKGDFDNTESLINIFNDCEVVFIVTNFWEHMDSKREYQQGKNLIDSAYKCGVNHIIWTTLEDTRKYNDTIPYIGDYKVPHFDEKGKLSDYLNTLNINSTHLYTSFFYENFTGLMKLKKDNDGVRRLCMPMNDSLLPIVSVIDIAKMTHYVVNNKLYGNVGVAGDHLYVHDIVSILSETFDEPVEYVNVPPNVYRSFGFPGCEDLGNMFEFKVIHNDSFCRLRDMSIVKSRITPLSFKEWCNDNKHLL